MRSGAHMSVAGGVHTAFGRGEAVGCTAMQIFVKNASQWSGKPIPSEHREAFFTERERTGIDFVIAHGSYLVNLASPDPALWKRSIAALVEELERSEMLGLQGLVVHPGAHVGSGESAGLARIARGLDRVFRRTRGYECPVLLETTAGQGSTLGHRFEQLAAIREAVAEPERVEYCLDTCHAFAAGYDLRTPRAVRATLRAFDEACGLGALRAIHLNDSLKPFASRRDRHAHIGEGEIGREGFATLLRSRRLARVPVILETPKGESMREDVHNLRVVRALAARKTPPSRRGPRTREWKKGTLAGARAAAQRTGPTKRGRSGSEVLAS